VHSRPSWVTPRHWHLLAVEEGGNDLADLEAGLTEVAATVARALDELELRSLFSGEHDERDAVAEIPRRRRRTDAQDWAEMMLRMYLRWAERRGFAVEVDEVSEGGRGRHLGSATFIVRGRYAYGLLAAERGVHRLVRMFAFRLPAQASDQFRLTRCGAVPRRPIRRSRDRREGTSRRQTYRSSGAGGQHVNVTDSAVRINAPSEPASSPPAERAQPASEQGEGTADLAAKLGRRQRAERRKELRGPFRPVERRRLGEPDSGPMCSRPTSS